MQLNDLRPASGSRSKSKRKGRGEGSGLGKTAGKGQGGQKSRSGGGVRRGFEGGQMPLVRRLPKRGFTNIFKKQIVVVNVEDLTKFDAGEEVTPEKMRAKGLVKDFGDGVKVLGRGEIDRKLTVKAHAFSRAAIEKIEAAGGKVEVV